MARGGARAGAGRPKGTKKPIKPESEKAKKYTFWLYQWEVQTVRQYIKYLRAANNCDFGKDVKQYGIGTIQVNKYKQNKEAKTITYTIQDREAGNKIETGLTLAEAEKLLEQYEETDKKEGTFTPNFYEIVEE